MGYVSQKRLNRVDENRLGASQAKEAVLADILSPQGKARGSGSGSLFGASAADLGREGAKPERICGQLWRVFSKVVTEASLDVLERSLLGLGGEQVGGSLLGTSGQVGGLEWNPEVR